MLPCVDDVEIEQDAPGVPELALWRAVLLAAIEDAMRTSDFTWFTSDDFLVVCELGDIDADELLEAITRPGYELSSRGLRQRARDPGRAHTECAHRHVPGRASGAGTGLCRASLVLGKAGLSRAA